ncbi:MAG: TonB-dependent receptor [Schleiferiaceae bacterium]|nr:TonB-dependent receptor [Schleiferiaceae bacterium]MDG1758292.1 TonB-dependent receptor [Schleiferiaceae bacterium]MDG2225744.1 TonB-dependent receptor [Schleiferiaceae bacterium]
MRYRIGAIVLATIISLSAFGQSRPGSVRGVVKDKRTGEAIPQAQITISNGGYEVSKGMTDFDGRYNIGPVTSGTYEISCKVFGYNTVTMQKVGVPGGRPRVLDFKLASADVVLGEIEIKADFEAPLIEKGKTSQSFSQEQIRNMASRGLSAVLSLSSGVVQDEASGASYFRGGRSDANAVFIDGVRVRGSVNLPREAIAKTEVITGGVPASYGDATGGIISTTTRGPSSRFFGTGEYVTSALFDNYNYHLAGLTIGGPLLFNKAKTAPLVGYLFSGEIQHNGDGRPYSVPIYKVNDDVLADLESNPLVSTSTGLGTISRAELIRKGDLEIIPRRLNVATNSIRATGNINIKPSRKTNVVIGGRFNSGYGKSGSFSNSLMNWKTNGSYDNKDFSTFLRFTQQFGGIGDESDAVIRNAYYTIQVDYSLNLRKSFDDRHGDNIFRYGHIGEFVTTRRPLYGYGVDEKTGVSAWRKLLDLDTNVSFTASPYNATLSNYTQNYYDMVSNGQIANRINNLTNIQQGGGLLNGQGPSSVYSLFGNVGAVQSGYSYSKNEQFRITASTSFDLRGHSLTAGLEYEQRTDRSFGVAARGLWTLMRGLQNDQMRELDLDNPNLVYKDGVFMDTINYNRAIDMDKPRSFDRNLRRALGWDPNGSDQRLLDIDGISPDDLNNYGGLALFSAQELLNFGSGAYVAYHGYDYQGNLLTYNPSLDDFFNAKDLEGNNTHPIAAFQPIYMAGYIQDQFTFDDLFFNIGVRIDRFDANQPVPSDPFTLYSSRTVSDVQGMGGLSGSEIPTSMGDDYVVYVDNIKNPKKIVGYRNGFDWFNADGTPQSNPTEIANLSGGQAKPWIFEENFTDESNPDQPVLSAKGFKDYEPQVTISPRISFQFPISDEAEFFAHYDLLVQRPNAVRFNPVNYVNLQFGSLEGIANPSLKPQKLTEYEIGFRQKLTERSALKINGFYREYRDLIQSVSVTEAYPATYIMYGNRDFTTAKGFSFQYDLRRTGNIMVNANYSLSFADGTGSGANSGLSLARSGQPNLRYIQPLSYDQRHNFSTNIDFRYRGGTQYNGPVIKNMRVFENAGVNLLMTTASGFPYSRRIRAYGLTESAAPISGLLNGSRKPWQFKMDMTANKVWYYAKGKKNVELYMQVLNVMNALNVLDIYPYTGSPTDDGFLSSPQGQQSIAFTTNAQSFADFYNIAVIDPSNFSIPRRIRLGIRLGL